MANLTAQTIPVPYDGIDADSSPDQIPDSKAPVVENFLTEPGKLVMRGPIQDTWPTTLGFGAGEMPIGVWRHNDNLLIGARKVSATEVRDPWTALYRKAPTAAGADLSSIASTIKHVNLTTGAVTSIAVAGLPLHKAPGWSSVRIGPHVYGTPHRGTVPLFLDDSSGYIQGGILSRWDGTATALTEYATAPYGAQGIVAHYQRLLLLGGATGGSAVYDMNTVRWSDVVGGPTALPDLATAWQDDVTGLENQIVVGADDGDFLVGAAHIGTNLAIFKRHATYVMLGYSPATWTIKTISHEIGCIDPRSIVEYEDGCFFMSDRGFMYFDGTQFANTTTPGLRSTLVEAALNAVGDSGTDGGYVTASCLPNGHIMVCIGTAPSASVNSVRTNTYCGIYNVTRRTWTTLTCQSLPGGATAPFYGGRSITKSYALDDNRVVSTLAVPAPERAAAANRGFDRVNSVSSAILSKYTTKLMRLAGPLTTAQLHRFILDYNWKRNGADQATTATGDAWKVTLASASGVALQTAYRVRSSSDGATSYTYRRRNVTDIMTETSELQVTVEATAPAVAITRAEALMSYIEFQPTRLRPTE